MIIKDSTHPIDQSIIHSLKTISFNIEHLLFFDIETTGFSRSRDSITSITFLSFISKIQPESNPLLSKAALDNANTSIEFQAQITQIFCETPEEEHNLLLQSKAFFDHFSIFVTYNGHSFDIPFLQSKYQYYNIFILLNKCMSIDLYSISKKILKLYSYKLKEVEKVLNISRKDQLSGKECIEFYYKYLETKDLKYANLILEHNIEDVINMIYISRIFNHDQNYFAKHLKVIPIYYRQSLQNIDQNSLQVSNKFEIEQDATKSYISKFNILDNYCEIELTTLLNFPKYYYTVNHFSIEEISSCVYKITLPITLLSHDNINLVAISYADSYLPDQLTFADTIIQYDKQWVYENIEKIAYLLIHHFTTK